MMEIEQDCILTSALNNGEKMYQAFLTKSYFIIYPKETAATNSNITGVPCQKVFMPEVFAVTYENECVKTKNGNRNEIELSTRNQFAIHNIVRCKNHKWKTKKHLFSCSNIVLCQTWVDSMRTILTGFDRPRQLMIFVNPVGGKKQAIKIFREKVSPLFTMAGIKQEVIITERANHAHSVVVNSNLEHFDGIIAVGGDGMFSEVLNGVLSRDSSINGPSIKPKIKLGLIPAGSTDTVVFCTTGTNDPISSALHIIIGDDLPIDICSVWRDDKLIKYSVSLMGYGFFGDVIRDSENLRWMGPRRYDVAGFRSFMANRSYAGELSFLPASAIHGDPRQRERCIAGCEKCSRTDESSLNQDSPSWKTIRGRFISVIGANITCRCAKSLDGISPNAHLGDGCFDLIIIRKTTRLQYLRHMLRISNRGDHFGFDFIEVFKVKEFKFYPLPSTQAICQEDHDNTSENPTKDLVLRDVARSGPSLRQRNEQSVWNIDGELVDEPHLHVRNHRQLVSIFARGIEMIEETPTCGTCRRKSLDTQC